MVLVIKNLPANAGGIRDVSSIPRLGRILGEGRGNTLQYSCLENPTDRGAWQTMIHRFAKSWMHLKRLSMHMHLRVETPCFNHLVTTKEPAYVDQVKMAEQENYQYESRVFWLLYL